MTKLEFYRGRLNSYDPVKHGSGIYFTTDTVEIIHDSKSYAFAPSKEILEKFLVGSIKNIQIDEETGEMTYDTIELDNGELVEVKSLKFPVAIPGYMKAGVFTGGSDGLMSSMDKYNLDTLVSDEKTKGSVKNTVSSYLSWKEISE